MTDPAYQPQRITGGGPHAGEADLALAAQIPARRSAGGLVAGLAGPPRSPARDDVAPSSDRQRRGWLVAATLLAWLDADADRPAEIDPDRLAALLPGPTWLWSAG